jgi:hypothetical protein
MKTLVVLYFFICVNSLFGQGVTSDIYIIDQKGSPVKSNPYVDIIGSPFYSSEWANSSLLFANGKRVHNVKTKVNLFSNEVHYLNETDQELAFPMGSVKEIEFISNGSAVRFLSGLPAFEKQTTNGSFFESLNTGKCQLVIHRSKKLIEKKEFNSAVVEKKFNNNETYFILINNSLVKFKRDEAYLLDVLKDQKEALLEFFKATKINLKKEGDVISVLSFYNSLQD